MVTPPFRPVVLDAPLRESMSRSCEKRPSLRCGVVLYVDTSGTTPPSPPPDEAALSARRCHLHALSMIRRAGTRRLAVSRGAGRTAWLPWTCHPLCAAVCRRIFKIQNGVLHEPTRQVSAPHYALHTLMRARGFVCFCPHYSLVVIILERAPRIIHM